MTAQLLLSTAITIVVGLAMLRMGFRHDVLEVRSSSRRCESCGRRIRGHCPHCPR
jgi:hypothetical protein